MQNQQTTFSSTSTCPATPCTYQWLHGDAASTDEFGTGPQASFTYTGAPGPRQVTLKVTDSQSRSNTSTQDFQLVAAAATPTPTPTATPSATPTATPSPTPTPTPGTYPNGFNTGVPSGTILTPSGGMTITTAGQVVDGKDISGPVVVNAPNVTIKNSRIRASDFWVVDNNSTGLTIQDSEIDGLGANNTCVGSSSLTVLRSNIHHCENGFNVSGTTTVQDSYVHDLTTANGAHTDGAQFNQGASDIVFRHNTIDPVSGTSGGTSAIIMWDEVSPQNSRVWVEDNRLLGQGASFTIYTPRQAGSTDLYVRQNRMQSGVFGYNGGNVSTVTEWSGNVDDTTGAPVGG